MTYADMRARVQAWLGLQDISVYDETAIIPRLLQEGTMDLLSRTKAVVRCVQLRVQANQDEYTLDHGILALVDVENGGRRKLRRDQSAGYDDNAVYYSYDGRDAPRGQPGFTLIRSDLLLVKPTPSVDGTIQVWAVMRPQQMALDADSPGMESFGAIPDEYHDAILSYALWKAADYSDDGASQNGDYYRVLYEGQDGRGGRLGQIRSQVNRRGTGFAAPAEVRLRSTSGSGAYVG